MTQMRFFVLTGFLLIAFATPTFAEDYEIFHPRVEKGEVEAHAHLNYDFDHRPELDNHFSQAVGVEYGINDWWQTEVNVEFERDNAERDDLTGLIWENNFAFTAPGAHWIDTGLHIELEKAMQGDEPDDIEASLLLEKNMGPVSTTANLTAGHEFGKEDESGWDTGLSLQSLYSVSEVFKPGFEYYGSFGNTHDDLSYSQQSHRIGPVAQGEIGAIEYDTGLLLGVSHDAPDATLKLNLAYKF